MRIKSIRLLNIKGFLDTGELPLSSGINLIVGANNAGKSTILRSIQKLQPTESTGKFFKNGHRIGNPNGDIFIKLCDPERSKLTVPEGWDFSGWQPAIRFTIGQNPQTTICNPSGSWIGYTQNFCEGVEPKNFIYHYFSQRKTSDFNYQINNNNSRTVHEQFQHLPSKIDELLTLDSGYVDEFISACQTILDLKISCIQFEGGKHVGLRLQDGKLLPIDNMGEGVLHILAFLARLIPAKGNIFLIEEIENDLHPRALKGLLQLIINKSMLNQFVLTTHSNIVLRYLGGAPDSKVFSVNMKLEDQTKVPISNCCEVSSDPAHRMSLLESLGYDSFDSYLWKAYLFLEESSAERIIKDFLIPTFYPKLIPKLKTIAAAGVDDLEPKWNDFLRLFVFVHTTPIYKQRAWVIADGDDAGKQNIIDLQKKFSKDWPENHFRTFTKRNFEEFYPKQFQAEIESVLATPDKQAKRNAKRELLEKVITWASCNPVDAKKAFKESAEEVLNILGEIEKQIG